MRAGAQGFALSSTVFPGHKHGIGLEMEQVGHEPVSIWNADATGGGLGHSITFYYCFKRFTYLFERERE